MLPLKSIKWQTGGQEGKVENVMMRKQINTWNLVSIHSQILNYFHHCRETIKDES